MTRSMHPGQRILTADYLYKAAHEVINCSFRKAADSFNTLLDRKGTDDELSVTTMARDVILAGQSLIAYKVQETASILSEFGFDPSSGLFSKDCFPDSLRNHVCTMVTFSPAVIAGMSEEEWVSSHSVITAEKSESSQPPSCSQPDMQEFVCRPKRRTSRQAVDPDKMESSCSAYIRWINEHAYRPEYGVLHTCVMEKNSDETLYIMIDAVMVVEQEGKRVKGGKAYQKSETTRLKHWNIHIETGDSVYGITSMDEEEAYKELIVFILKNHLYNRYFIFFVDGETAIFNAIEKYFAHWEYTIILDWYHCVEKVNTLLSLAIYPRRINDPRTEAKVVMRGKNKGREIRKKVSLSRLYARAVIRILWYGNVQEAIYYLNNISEDDIQNPEAIGDLLKYLRRKGQYIANSGVRKKAGLRNSSNGVEGQNMVVVADRQKDKDMSWREKGSSSLAALAQLFANHEEKDWFFENKITFKLYDSSPAQDSTQEFADDSNTTATDPSAEMEDVEYDE